MTPVEKGPGAGLNGMVATVLRAERAAQRLTQEDIAEAAGIPQVSLRRYLNGQRHIDMSVLAAICEALDVEPKWVLEEAAERLRLSERRDTSDDAVAAHEEEVPIVGEHGESETP